MKPETNNNRFEKVAEIYEKYLAEVKIFFLRYAHDAMQAEDMAQDLFMKLMNYDEMIQGPTAKSFVFTIARRMVVDDARHQEFIRRATASYAHAQERFWHDCETLEAKQLQQMELSALARLPKKMAQVYQLTRFEEKSSQELAEELHISRRTVEYHLLVSRREIRSMLRKAINQ